MSRRCRDSLQDTFTDDKDPLDPSGSSGCRCRQIGRGGGIPCVDPILQGIISLRDPGFENHIAETDGGVEGDEIPGAAVDFHMEWTDGEDILVNNAHGWVAGHNELDPDFYAAAQQRVQRWWVDTTNPKTGTYHLRTKDSYDNTFPVQPEFVFPLGIWAIDFWACEPKPLTGTRHPYTLKCGAGDLITIRCQAMYTDISMETWGLGTSDPIVPGITMDVNAFSLDQTSEVASSADKILTASYAAYEASFFVTNPSLVEVGITAFSSGTPPDDFVEVAVDADDFSISLTPAGSNALLCAFASLITIDNSTTETDFL